MEIVSRKHFLINLFHKLQSVHWSLVELFKSSVKMCQSANLRQICWNSPNLWLLVSMPVPITSPPTVKSSSSGTMGIVQPSLKTRTMSIPQTFLKQGLQVYSTDIVLPEKRTILDDDIFAVYLTPFPLPSSPTSSEDDESFLSSTSCRF